MEQAAMTMLLPQRARRRLTWHLHHAVQLRDERCCSLLHRPQLRRCILLAVCCTARRLEMALPMGGTCLCS